MQNQVCCDIPTDGSGAEAASSSPNRRLDGRNGEPAVTGDCLALPAGHPLSWGLLTAGTLLEGAAFADLH